MDNELTNEYWEALKEKQDKERENLKKALSNKKNHELAGRFMYHPPSQGGVVRHSHLTDVMLAAAMVVDATCPAGREKSLAMTKLEEAKMWASAAVARNEETR